LISFNLGRLKNLPTVLAKEVPTILCLTVIRDLGIAVVVSVA
jgi:hypothetical protein